MFKNALLGLFILTCGLIGYFSFNHLAQINHKAWMPWVGTLVGVSIACSAVLIERYIRNVPLPVITGGTIGLALGLIVARLLSLAFDQLHGGVLGAFLYVMLSVFFGYLGLAIGGRKFSELQTPSRSSNLGHDPVSKELQPQLRPKVVDTSAIIDARLADMCATGWIDGPLIVPSFVLQELQYIADSTDPRKRTRGRRGLEALEKIKDSSKVKVRIIDKDYPHLKDTDAKLVRLCQEWGAKLITTDYNLNKVARLEGVEVLNVNDLSLALRPIVSAGEVLHIYLVKAGKEKDQAVGYLDDGTMVVVENGRPFIGQEVDVVVTSLLQTPAGRIIFGQVKEKKTDKAVA